MFRIK